MNKKTILFAVIGVTFLFLLMYFIKPDTETVSKQIISNEDISIAEEVSYLSPNTGESLSVSFSDNKAVLHSDNYSDLVLAQVESASGAKYENRDSNITVWNKGSEISVYQDEVLTFQGQTPDSINDTDKSDSNVLEKTLTTSPWLWQKTEMSDGSIITPKKLDAFTLTFNGDGRVNGTTDCNGFGGSYSVTDNVITFGEFMMTMMYCEGSQEMEFQKMLSKPVTYMITETGDLVLMLPYDSGSVIFSPV